MKWWLAGSEKHEINALTTVLLDNPNVCIKQAMERKQYSLMKRILHFIFFVNH